MHSSDHPPPLISAAESRRRTQAPRFRRSRVYSSSSDRDRDSDDELADPAVFDHIIASSMRAGGDDVRAAQFIRGSVSTKMVASPSAIRSLQSVQIEDLAESERRKSHIFFILYALHGFPATLFSQASYSGSCADGLDRMCHLL